METVLAAAGVLVCVALLIHMALPLARRRQVDAAARNATYAVRRWAERSWHSLRQLGRGRPSRSARKDAAEVADEAIRRARGGVTRDGNVYKPKSFKGPRKPH